MKTIKISILAIAILALFSGELKADTPLFFEGFETRISPSALDANTNQTDYTNGPNVSPNGGPGNPWWSEFPPDLRVTQSEILVQSNAQGAITNSVSPHAGTNMVRGTGNSSAAHNRDFMNIAYRVNHSNVYSGNLTFDWWFYDPVGTNAAQSTNYQDYASLAYYTSIPTTTDYAADQFSNAVAGFAVTRLSIGASDAQGAGYLTTNYQAQILGTTATNAYNTGSGWFNLPVVRSVGWHHARILVYAALTNGTANAWFYVDNMTNAVLTNNSAASAGFNCIVLQAEYNTTLTGWFDDISVTVPPTLSIAKVGTNMVVTWPGTGWTLQSSTNVTGSSFVDVIGASSPYTNALGGSRRFFRVRQ